MLCDQRIDDGDLLLDGRRGRARVDELDVAEFLRRLLPAVTPDIEVVDAEHLDDHGDAELLVREGCSRKLRQRRAGRQSGSQAFRDLSAIKVHVRPPWLFFCGPRRTPGFALDKSPPHLRHKPEARCPTLDMADSREVEM